MYDLLSRKVGFLGGSAGNLPALQGWEDPLEEGMATHSSILVWRIPKNREAWWATVRGVAESQTRLSA